MGAYCHTTVGCACALRAHPPPTTARDSRLASIASFAYNLSLCPTGPPTQKKIKKRKNPNRQWRLGLIVKDFLFYRVSADTNYFLCRNTNQII